MGDLSRVDQKFSIRQIALSYVGAQTNQEVIAATVNYGRHVLHSVVVSADTTGSFTLKENLSGARAVIVPTMYFGNNGGVGLEDMLLKITPNASVELTTVTTTNVSILIIYHTERGGGV